METKIQIVLALVAIVLIWGWIGNVIRLTALDFESPYKAEVLRIIGVGIAPMGMVLGYVDINDEKGEAK